MLFKLANLIMGAKFLGDTAAVDPGAGAQEISNYIVSTVKSIMIPILGIVSAAGMIWAIVLGVNMARADSTEKREEAKKRLIGLIVGIVIMVALILFFIFGLDSLVSIFTKGTGVEKAGV